MISRTLRYALLACGLAAFPRFLACNCAANPTFTEDGGDSGIANDAGAGGVDGGSIVDGSSLFDAAGLPDGNVGGDSGAVTDGGSGPDGSTEADSGTLADSGGSSDAGSVLDGGMIDAGNSCTAFGGNCNTGLDCFCCPGPGPTENCLCSTPCGSNRDCTNGDVCKIDPLGGDGGFCAPTGFFCCWLCG